MTAPQALGGYVPATSYATLLAAYDRLDAECGEVRADAAKLQGFNTMLATHLERLKESEQIHRKAYGVAMRELKHRSEQWKMSFAEAELAAKMYTLAMLALFVMTVVAGIGWLR